MRPEADQSRRCRTRATSSASHRGTSRERRSSRRLLATGSAGQRPDRLRDLADSFGVSVDRGDEHLCDVRDPVGVDVLVLHVRLQSLWLLWRLDVARVNYDATAGCWDATSHAISIMCA